MCRVARRPAHLYIISTPNRSTNWRLLRVFFFTCRVEVEGAVTVNFGKVMERLRKLRAGISHHDSAKRFTSLGIDVYIGHGEFSSHNTVEVCICL